MSESELTRNPVEELAEEFLARYRRGERPELTEYAQRHPGLADEIRDLFPALLMVEQAAPGDGPPPADPVPQQLGDFRIVREVGRGGMGVVYEAVQTSLGRRVALKVLPASLAGDASSRQRFHREARSAARLHHTNIVPVFEVGERHGVSYYAMQFIKGQSLDGVLRELRRLVDEPGRRAARAGLPLDADQAPPGPPTASLARALRTGQFPVRESLGGQGVKKPAELAGSAPTPVVPAAGGALQLAAPGLLPLSDRDHYHRAVARLALQAAEALAYAHGQKILHRDIKPANLLLDVEGVLWVTDFGLAKEEGTDLTRTGGVIGTLRYMAPERFRGAADARSDVYSLGATLYELLTLRPAFVEPDQERLIRQVLQDEPPRPSHIEPEVPRDLETVCLKAMAKDPAHRYRGAAALAEDLSRFLADQPIRARRTSMLEYCWRWCRRNRVAATLAALVTGLVVAVAVVAVVDDYRLREQEAATRRRLYESLVAQARASRLSRRAGQRFESLKALQAATQIARQMKFADHDFRELRNEAIASLALPDLRVTHEWSGWPEGSAHLDFDGRLERYVRTDYRGIVSVRRVSDDEQLCHFESRLANAWPRLSPDGRYLALSDPPRMQVWQLDRLERLDIPPESACTAYEFSPDNRWLAAAQTNGTINLYDLARGQRVRQLPPGPCPVHSTAFHPDSNRLAVSHAGGVQVRDLATGAVERDFPLTGAEHVVWHPDGRTLAAVGGDRMIHLWNVSTTHESDPLWKWKSTELRISFNGSGDLLASVGREQMLRLWEPRIGSELFHTPVTFPGASLRFGNDRVLAAGIRDGRLSIWEVVPGHECRRLIRNPARGEAPYSPFSVSPAGPFLAVRTPEGFGLWDRRTGASLASVSAGPLDDIVFEPSGALLTAGPAGIFRWPIGPDTRNAESTRLGPPQRLSLPGTHGSQIACSVSGRAVASAHCWGGLVLLADQPDLPVRLEPHKGAQTVAISPDQRWVATGSRDDAGVRVWDAQTGEPVKDLVPQEGWVQVTFSPDGRWLATRGNNLRLWAVGSWQQGLSLSGIAGAAVAFSPTEKLLAMETGYGTVRLVDPDTGREYARLAEPDQVKVTWMCFSPDGQELLTSGSGNEAWIRVWNLRAIRRELAEMGLDWELPPYRAVEERNGASTPRVIVDPAQ
jgi:serine/threonine protein kinase/WD40 repeat protein